MAQVDFENLLKNAMGLDKASIGSSTIERAVQRRMATMGLEQPADYWQEVRRSKIELQELIEAVVVPETWFFRDREAFTSLVRLISEEWRPAHPTRVLRLLSAPCSTGEEPYSMIMSLLDGGFTPQQLHVDAVDISARALAHAAQGVYGSNSFRGTSLEFRERYFEPAANDYALPEWLRSMVTFRQKNLLAPDFSPHQQPYDVIFCRNLLIYFDKYTQGLVLKTLARLLAPDGFLFVGPAEGFLASCSGFTSVNQAMSFAYRKTSAPSVEPQIPISRSPKPVKVATPPRITRIIPAQIFTAPVSAPPPPPPDLEAARRWADAGRLQEAAAWCQANLTEQGPSPETYFLLGLVRDAMGDRIGAAEFYRRVIYLEPEHVEALMQLALVSEAQGDVAAAGRLRARARKVESRIKEKAS